MITYRKAAASIPILEGSALWVTGGSFGDTVFNTSEIVHLDGTTEEGPELPSPIEFHCMAKLAPGHFFMAGADVIEPQGNLHRIRDRNVYIYDESYSKWFFEPL